MGPGDRFRHAPGAAFAPPSAPSLDSAADDDRSAPPASERLAFSHVSLDRTPLDDVLDACASAGIGWFGAWRHHLAAHGVAESARRIRSAGIRVSGLCRGGMFPATTAAERARRIDDNRRAVDEAAELGTGVLCLVSGPAADRDIEAARAQVEEGIVALLPYAKQCGITLGLEPLHPVFAADRSVVVTLRQANDIIERVGDPALGLVVDVYHTWWDPDVHGQIARAAGRIVGYHVSDWAPGVSDPFLGRQLPGDGVIELRRLRRAVEGAGYGGPIEVELINPAIWDMAPAALLEKVGARYASVV
jgi:sugar phosphate isomerase/epimerase